MAAKKSRELDFVSASDIGPFSQHVDRGYSSQWEFQLLAFQILCLDSGVRFDEIIVLDEATRPRVAVLQQSRKFRCP